MEAQVEGDDLLDGIQGLCGAFPGFGDGWRTEKWYAIESAKLKVGLGVDRGVASSVGRAQENRVKSWSATKISNQR